VAGRYRLEEPIGSGGMGRVYRAHDEVLDREVAVKLLEERPAPGADRGFAYAEEARAAARLTHPGIARVYDSGFQDGHGFVVMELVPGQLLSEVLRERQTLPPLEAAELIAQVADALEAAHQQEIIHCDVKPQNIILTPDGTPKLVDFGIARAANVARTEQTAELFGSVAYLAPEQARGERLDARTDVYALGSVLYEVLTGRPPWLGRSAADVIAQKLVDDPPSPRALDATIPPEVAQSVVTALARDPARRYQSAGAFRDALRAAAGHVGSMVQTRTVPIVRVPGGGTAAQLPWRRRVGVRLAAAVMLLALGALLLTASASRYTPQEQVTPPDEAPAPSGTSIQLTAPATAAPTIQPTAQSTVASTIEPLPRLPAAPAIAPADPPSQGGGSPGQNLERRDAEEARKKSEEAEKKADDERKKAQDDVRTKPDGARGKPQDKGPR
jgi:serine/threonine-protein kinase